MSDERIIESEIQDDDFDEESIVVVQSVYSDEEAFSNQHQNTVIFHLIEQLARLYDSVARCGHDYFTIPYFGGWVWLAFCWA